MRERTLGIHIRVTAQEKNRIARYAKRCGLTVSEYLRQLAKGHTPQELSHKNFGGEQDGDNENLAHP
jgi:cytochrome b